MKILKFLKILGKILSLSGHDSCSTRSSFSLAKSVFEVKNKRLTISSEKEAIMPKVTKTNQSSVNTEVGDQLQSHPTYEAYVQLQANYHHMVHVLKKARGNDVMVTPFPKFSDFRWMLRNGCKHFSVKQFIYRTGSAKVDAVYDYWFTIPQEVIDSYGNAQSNIDATESGN